MKIIRVFLPFLIFTFSTFQASSQSAQNDKDLFLDAEYFLMTEDYQEALSTFLKVHEHQPSNANINYRIGLCLLNIEGQKQKAISYLLKASDKISTRYSESQYSEKKAPPQVLFLLGTAYQIDNQLDDAIEYFEKYKKYLNVKDVYEIDFVDKQIKSCENAKEYIQHPIKLEHKHLDDIIPQDKANFNPIMAENGNVIIYMTVERFYNAVWMIRKIDNIWSRPVNITPQLQSDGDLFANSITGDGNILYLSRLSSFDGDLLKSEYKNGRWEKAEKLDKPINTRNWETHAGISPDGKTLYFTSNRKGGFGGLDIYKSRLNNNGEWEEPVNLGPTINTSYNEATPFILSDGVTLYFSSQGHEGMGGFDIYKSTMLTEGYWSVVENLGYPLNTTDDNLFYYPVGNGKKALYAGILDMEENISNIKALYLSSDILQADNTIKVSGNLSFQDNDIPDDEVSLIIKDLNGKDIPKEINYDKSKHKFSFNIEPGKYQLIASLEPYQSKTELINISDDFNLNELNMDIELIPKEVSTGEYIAIKNILFDYDSYELTRESQLDLERLYNVMVRYPALLIEVVGHTDARGNPDYNFDLSRKRASAVISYLTEKGVDPARFISAGAGEIENIALNINPDGSDNPEGRKRNRNVSIKIPQSEKYNIIVEPIPVPDHLKPSNSTIYSILLLSSDKSVNNLVFNDINQISIDGVNEHYIDSTYFYTLGRFYSKKQAEELLQSKFLTSYTDARVINLDIEIGLTGLTSSLTLSESDHFSIQVGAFKDPANTREYYSRKEFRTLKCGDDIYRILYGQYPDKEEASEALLEMKASGFDDAFIVDLQVLRRSKAAILIPESGTYVIQIKALNVPIGRTYFHGLSKVSVIEGPDNIYRYIYGNFTSIEAARSELDRIKKLGYSDAFVREISGIPEK